MSSWRRVPVRALWALLAVSSAGCGALDAAELGHLVEALALERGMVVADVGAGDGKWSVKLARRIGRTGKLIATEVDDEGLDDIRKTAKRSKADNIVVVRGDQVKTGLEENCCNAILLRLVYHHFTDPSSMRADLRRSLKPGARLAIVDIRPQEKWSVLPGVPDRGGHGIDPADLIEEMEGEGFEVIERYDSWNGDEDRYCIVFRSADESAGDG